MTVGKSRASRAELGISRKVAPPKRALHARQVGSGSFSAFHPVDEPSLTALTSRSVPAIQMLVDVGSDDSCVHCYRSVANEVLL